MMILLQSAVLLALQASDAASGNESRTAIPAAAQPQEVYTIDQPGSYFLTGNRFATGTAIRIQTNNVTLDLNGFGLMGAGGAKTYGVFLTGVRNVEIRNGTITRFGDRGIAGERHHEGVRIAHMRLLDNGACGICLDASGLVVTDCYVSGNKMTGVCVTRAAPKAGASYVGAACTWNSPLPTCWIGVACAGRPCAGWRTSASVSSWRPPSIISRN